VFNLAAEHGEQIARTVGDEMLDGTLAGLSLKDFELDDCTGAELGKGHSVFVFHENYLVD
jgi:hypothetical protein